MRAFQSGSKPGSAESDFPRMPNAKGSQSPFDLHEETGIIEGKAVGLAVGKAYHSNVQTARTITFYCYNPERQEIHPKRKMQLSEIKYSNNTISYYHS